MVDGKLNPPAEITWNVTGDSVSLSAGRKKPKENIGETSPGELLPHLAFAHSQMPFNNHGFKVELHYLKQTPPLHVIRLRYLKRDVDCNHREGVRRWWRSVEDLLKMWLWKFKSIRMKVTDLLDGKVQSFKPVKIFLYTQNDVFCLLQNKYYLQSIKIFSINSETV